jgi:protein-tyrosine phosphatase
MENTRYFKFDKACNFREIGGLDTSDGKRMKSGILYRSDELSQLTPNDRKIFRGLNIKMVIDLRGVKERKKKIDNIPADLNIPVMNIPIDHRNQDLKQMQFFLFLIQKSKEFDFDKYMKEHYFGTAFECTAQIKDILTLLSDEKNLPALIHCTVGKDRTGFMAAILQLLAGVPRQIVIEEYLVTNKYISTRINQIIRMVRIMSFFRASIEQIQPMLEVRPDYLNNVLDEIYNKYGSVENYLLTACGVDLEIQQKLKNLMMV